MLAPTVSLIIQQSELNTLLNPSRRQVKVLQRYLENVMLSRIPEDVSISGSEEDSKVGATDLTSTRHGRVENWFSEFVTGRFLEGYNKPIGKRVKRSKTHSGSFESYKRSRILRLTEVITTIVACVVSIVSIWVLLQIRSIEQRLYAIMGFNVAFACCLTVFARARRIEIFAATAA